MATIERLNQFVKTYDKMLYIKESKGMAQLYRKDYRFETYDIDGMTLRVAVEQPLFILALTDTWKLDGKPVEWGLEPFSEQLKSMDSWTRVNMFEEMVKRRERNEEIEKQSKKNEIRAVAADSRRDFAKATNDINVSSLAKTDRRRLKEK
jgi:hypothetical protein